MKKPIKLFSLLFCLTFITTNVIYTNALQPKNWTSGVKHKGKYVKYAFGMYIDSKEKTGLLRGKNWIYSGDKFAFHYQQSYSKAEQKKDHNVKFSYKIVKGSGNIKIQNMFDNTGTIKDFNNKIYSTTIKPNKNTFSILRFNLWSEVIVKCKKTCILQISVSQKVTSLSKWKTNKFKVKVKSLK